MRIATLASILWLMSCLQGQADTTPFDFSKRDTATAKISYKHFGGWGHLDFAYFRDPKSGRQVVKIHNPRPDGAVRISGLTFHPDRRMPEVWSVPLLTLPAGGSEMIATDCPDRVTHFGWRSIEREAWQCLQATSQCTVTGAQRPLALTVVTEPLLMFADHESQTELRQKVEELLNQNFGLRFQVARAKQFATREELSQARQSLVEAARAEGRLVATPYQPGFSLVPLLKPEPKREGLQDIEVSGTEVTLSAHDHGNEDGDRVEVFLNDQSQGSISLRTSPYRMQLNLQPGKNTLRVRALNEGSSPPNTATIRFDRVTSGRSEQKYNLKSGQEDSMLITAPGGERPQGTWSDWKEMSAKLPGLQGRQRSGNGTEVEFKNDGSACRFSWGVVRADGRFEGGGNLSVAAGVTATASLPLTTPETVALVLVNSAQTRPAPVQQPVRPAAAARPASVEKPTRQKAAKAPIVFVPFEPGANESWGDPIAVPGTEDPSTGQARIFVQSKSFKLVKEKDWPYYQAFYKVINEGQKSAHVGIGVARQGGPQETLYGKEVSPAKPWVSDFTRNAKTDAPMKGWWIRVNWK